METQPKNISLDQIVQDIQCLSVWRALVSRVGSID
jgi:hypothetical protein